MFIYFFKYKVRKEPPFTFYRLVITSYLRNRRHDVSYLVICCIVTSFFVYREINNKKSLSDTLAIRNHGKKMNEIIVINFKVQRLNTTLRWFDRAVEAHQDDPDLISGLVRYLLDHVGFTRVSGFLPQTPSLTNPS